MTQLAKQLRLQVRIKHTYKRSSSLPALQSSYAHFQSRGIKECIFIQHRFLAARSTESRLRDGRLHGFADDKAVREGANVGTAAQRDSKW